MKQLICIVCPNGCRLTVEKKGEDYVVTGGKCRRGDYYAKTEMTAPMRSLTTTVATVFDEARVLPVRTDGEIPKGRMMDVMQEVNRFLLNKRVTRGEVVMENVCGLGINVIATSDILTSHLGK